MQRPRQNFAQIRKMNIPPERANGYGKSGNAGDQGRCKSAPVSPLEKECDKDYGEYLTGRRNSDERARKKVKLLQICPAGRKNQYEEKYVILSEEQIAVDGEAQRR